MKREAISQDELLRRWHADEPVSSIARRFDITESAIYQRIRHLRKRGIRVMFKTQQGRKDSLATTGHPVVAK